MSYAVSAALQEAVYGALAADVALQALVGGDIYDAPPGGTLPLTYVILGEEDARVRSDVTANGSLHDLVVSVISDASGFQSAKQVAVAVSDALEDAPLVLSRGQLVSLGFRRARARRGKSPDQRRIDLVFRARVDDI